jgi:hypothetical protein
MFDRAAHMRKLTNDPVLRAKRELAHRQRVCIVWDADMDAKLTEMALAGFGAVPIADAVGVGKKAVRDRRKILGLPNGKPPGPKRKVRPQPGTVIVRILERGESHV